ncbi:hypothetical protein N7540_008499 [Penicillium herquei]|nr:hypothetical protein N7540_008499 [Penicillium herquei]
MRNVECFREFVAPMIAGPFPSFWTELVPQMTYQEPITRHAMMAISSFFVQFVGDSSRPPTTADLRFAHRHYGNAIQEIMSAKTDNLDVVVTACILLIGVEFLRGCPESAIFHTRHAMRLVKAYKPRVELEATLALFNAFILLLPDCFPEMPQPVEYKSPCGVAGFSDLVQAKQALTELTSRAVGLAFARENQESCQDTESPSDSEMSVEFQQRKLNEDLDAFYALLLGLERFNVNMNRRGNRLFKARWLVCKIWANDGLSPDAPYSAHEYYFRQILDIVSDAYLDGPKFIFGIEFTTILLFVLRQCRDKQVHLAALRLFKNGCCARQDLSLSQHLYTRNNKVVPGDVAVSDHIAN